MLKPPHQIKLTTVTFLPQDKVQHELMLICLCAGIARIAASKAGRDVAFSGSKHVKCRTVGEVELVELVYLRCRDSSVDISDVKCRFSRSFLQDCCHSFFIFFCGKEYGVESRACCSAKARLKRRIVWVDAQKVL